jgi:septation ring formation regulator EzrA
MKHQRHFERTSDVASREADQIRTLIANLERTVQILDCDIATEEECAGVSDRTDAAYPILARTLAARRDNLKATAAALEKRVSGLQANQTELVPELTSGRKAVERIPLSVPAAS